MKEVMSLRQCRNEIHHIGHRRTQVQTTEIKPLPHRRTGRGWTRGSGRTAAFLRRDHGGVSGHEVKCAGAFEGASVCFPAFIQEKTDNA